MREIVLDTETTGLEPGDGHRIVEIGCIELVDRLPSGREFHKYLDPERDIPPEAFEIHGLSGAFLSKKPRFGEIARAFLDFIATAPLVVHNAPFDLGFLNAELVRVELPPIPLERAVDTLLLAKRKFPNAPVSLDALCRRFAIDNSGRTRHGALLDAELLAEVYLELLGERQTRLGLGAAQAEREPLRPAAAGPQAIAARAPRPHAPTPEEEAAHAAFIAALRNPIWNG